MAMILTKVCPGKRNILFIIFIFYYTGYGHKSHGYHDDHKGYGHESHKSHGYGHDSHKGLSSLDM